MRTVYDNGGECLGDEFVNLAGLQQSTKDAIQQMVHLEETLVLLRERTNSSEHLKIVDTCFRVYTSSLGADAKSIAKSLLDTY